MTLRDRLQLTEINLCGLLASNNRSWILIAYAFSLICITLTVMPEHSKAFAETNASNFVAPNTVQTQQSMDASSLTKKLSPITLLDSVRSKDQILPSLCKTLAGATTLRRRPRGFGPLVTYFASPNMRVTAPPVSNRAASQAETRTAPLEQGVAEKSKLSCDPSGSTEANAKVESLDSATLVRKTSSLDDTLVAQTTSLDSMKGDSQAELPDTLSPDKQTSNGRADESKIAQQTSSPSAVAQDEPPFKPTITPPQEKLLDYSKLPLTNASTYSRNPLKYFIKQQMLSRNFSMPDYQPPPYPTFPRRAPPPALDPVFPSQEFLGTNSQAPIGVNDYNYATYPLEVYLWKNCPILRKNRIRVYGWLNPGYNYGTSHHSNFPMSYIVASRQLHWDQVIGRIERVPDTVQQEHPDWGFRFTSLYGEDYRFTTAKGWVSNQLLHYNNLTGWDPVELFGILYVPKILGHKVFDGLSVRVGRYVATPDIEAQLAPDNYLFTHSLMFTVDTYTQTGIQTWFQLNKYWNVMLGFHGGADTAPWTNSTVPTGQMLVRWVSKNNKDSIYTGINDINGMSFRNALKVSGYGLPPGTQGKDNLQQVNFNWTHVFNRRFHTVTEAYYLWTTSALRGGTVNNGPVKYFGGGGGPGVFLPGTSQAIGLVNYTLFKATDRDYLAMRPIDMLFDDRGWRTGVPQDYMSHTIGWVHRFSDTLSIRPELRLENALLRNNLPYDKGTKRRQLTFACDLIQRF